MVLLMLFALIAGAGTAITPCVLPVLPALLSRQRRRRPPPPARHRPRPRADVHDRDRRAGPAGQGRRPGQRRRAHARRSSSLIGFGVVLLIPEVGRPGAGAALAPGALRTQDRAATASGRGSGSAARSASSARRAPARSWPPSPRSAPRAAPRPGSSRSRSRTRSGSAPCCCSTRSAAAALIARIRRAGRGHVVERTLGGDPDRDRRSRWPPTSTCASRRRSPRTPACPPSSSIRRARSRTRAPSRAGSRRCGRSRGSPCASARPARSRSPPRRRLDPGVKTPSLPNLGAAPDFTDTQRWFNTPGGRPLTLAGLRGHVVLVDFWTYTCINCIRTLPFLKGLYATYHRYGLEIVGVETPEFTFEQDAGNVAAGDPARTASRYPVVQDNDYGTWNAYQNQYWPAEYLIDAHGQVRHTQFGEGDYKQSEAAVRELLYEAGARQLPPPMTAHAIIPAAQLGDAGDLPRSGPGSGIRDAAGAGRALLPGRELDRPEPVRAQGHLEARPRSRPRRLLRGVDRGRLPGRRRLPGDDLGRQHARGRSASCSTGGRSRPPRPAPTSTTGPSPSRASACTPSSICPRPSSTRSRSSSRPASAPTTSRSARGAGASIIAAARSRSSGALTLNSTSGSSTSSRTRDRAPPTASRRRGGVAARRASARCGPADCS